MCSGMISSFANSKALQSASETTVSGPFRVLIADNLSKDYCSLTRLSVGLQCQRSTGPSALLNVSDRQSPYQKQPVRINTY